MIKLCPCGSQQRLAKCCLPYIMGNAHAPTAEALMRSRYTAHCRNNHQYLTRTSAEQAANINYHTTSQHTQRWDHLDILHVTGGMPQDTAGTVEFTAHYYINSQHHTLHEISTFKKISGLWYYVSGQHIDA